MNKSKLIELKKIGERGITIQTQDILNALLEDDTPVTPTPTKTPKFFVPKVGEEYWFVNSYKGVQKTLHVGTSSDCIAISLGVYRTEEECTQAFEKQKALVRLWKNADEKYFFRPDGEDEQQLKCDIIYSHSRKTYTVYASQSGEYNFSFSHFATREDGENFIKENEKDLEIYRVN